jgi:hypothetical protein
MMLLLRFALGIQRARANGKITGKKHTQKLD